MDGAIPTAQTFGSLKTLPINVRIWGIEYKDKSFTGKDVCLNRDIDFYYNRRDHSFSSTDLRKRVYEAEKGKIKQDGK